VKRRMNSNLLGFISGCVKSFEKMDWISCPGAERAVLGDSEGWVLGRRVPEYLVQN
jgi:hypothetical protein